uniref:Ionotropic glutamate receptor C-terminal domain-containing protein n=1 Tax=Anopheles farauti TaxID=69004 RepID=A0A182QUF9_9DIPT
MAVTHRTMPGVVVALVLALLVAVRVTGDGVGWIARTVRVGTDPVRVRLEALERRFVGERDEPRTVVLLQVREAEAGVVGAEDDRSLSQALEAFVGHGDVHPWVVYRVVRGRNLTDIVTAIGTATGAGQDSWCGIVFVLLLPNLSIETGQQLTVAIARYFPLAPKVILITGDRASSGDCPALLEGQEAACSLLSTLWRTEKALRIVAAWYACPIALLFDPFAPTHPNETCSSGAFHTVTDLHQTTPAPVRSTTLNLHRTPIDIYGFEAPMAYRRQDIDMLPRTFPARNVSAATPNVTFLDTLFGADVEALRALAVRLNFTPRIHHVRANFGFRQPNGTFTGVLGRLVNRDAWLSMNVYFLKDYETRELQFGAGIYQDSLCVFVRATGMLPDWMLIFRCFTPTLWIVVSCTVVLVSLCYVGLTHCSSSAAGPRSERKPARTDTGALVGQIVGALLTAPTAGINRTTAHQKLFVAFGLIWGLTITGAFQGSLVDVYTTPTSMKNLDTLPELDATGLTITVNAPALIVDVFGTERPGTTLGNLKRRLVIETNPSRTATNTILAGDTAGLIRNQDFGRLSTKYLAQDGTPRLHRLRQCPRSYTLAYLYPRGSPLYRAANGQILRLLQHGLYAKWERDAAHILAMNQALKVHRYRERSGRGATAAAGQVTLRLDHLLLPFMLLASGIALGACCLLCELRCRSRASSMVTEGRKLNNKRSTGPTHAPLRKFKGSLRTATVASLEVIHSAEIRAFIQPETQPSRAMRPMDGFLPSRAGIDSRRRGSRLITQRPEACVYGRLIHVRVMHERAPVPAELPPNTTSNRDGYNRTAMLHAPCGEAKKKIRTWDGNEHGNPQEE